MDSYLNNCLKTCYFITLCMRPRSKKMNIKAEVVNWIDNEKVRKS